MYWPTSSQLTLWTGVRSSRHRMRGRDLQRLGRHAGLPFRDRHRRLADRESADHRPGAPAWHSGSCAPWPIMKLPAGCGPSRGRSGNPGTAFAVGIARAAAATAARPAVRWRRSSLRADGGAIGCRASTLSGGCGSMATGGGLLGRPGAAARAACAAGPAAEPPPVAVAAGGAALAAVRRRDQLLHAAAAPRRRSGRREKPQEGCRVLGRVAAAAQPSPTARPPPSASPLPAASRPRYRASPRPCRRGRCPPCIARLPAGPLKPASGRRSSLDSSCGCQPDRRDAGWWCRCAPGRAAGR